jgi:hypothetical protein
VRDTGDLLVLARWPGVVGWWDTAWIDWLRTGNAGTRVRAIEDLAQARWTLESWTWRDTTKLTFLLPDAHFGVDLIYPGEVFTGEQEPRGWYVNFQRPFARTRFGVDTLDLLLDLVIEPDLHWRWKDSDEYEQGRALGIVTDTDHRAILAARDRISSLLEHREGPFADQWRHWRRETTWPLPVLPADALTSIDDPS